LEYWRQQLAGMEDLDLPTDHPRPAVSSYRGASQHLVLERELKEKLRELSQREGVTLFMMLLAAFQLLLHRYSWREDIPVATGVANRTRSELEPLIGFFVNTLVLRSGLAGGPSVRELLGRVRETALGAYAHQDVPFERLVEDLAPERDLSRTPLFQVVFDLQNTPSSTLELPEVKMVPLRIESGMTHFDLTMAMEETPDQLAGTLEYNRDLFEPKTIVQMLKNYVSLLEAMTAQPERRILDVPLHPEDDKDPTPTSKPETQTAENPLEAENFLF
jgi:non-ribosomal peptide synthetase component F